MIVVDIGNTNIVIGIYHNKKIKKTIRLENKIISLKKLNIYFNSKQASKIKLDYKICVISSVSSILEKELIIFFKKLKLKILNINKYNIPKNIDFNYISNELGADRIANSFAAVSKYGKNSIVIDFGTATTFDIIYNRNYDGGLIAPGINISHDALVFNAHKLKKISIAKPINIIGNDTKNSMQSGFYWGYTSLINGLIKKIIDNKKFKPNIILTGGLANTFKSEINFKTYYEPNLTLDGLYLIGIAKYA